MMLWLGCLQLEPSVRPLSVVVVNVLVKAFNTTFASRHADPVVDGVPVDILVAADDDNARAKVTELVGSLGFRPIDAGPLVMARALEAMGLLNILLQIRHGWPWQTGWKLLGPLT